MHNNASFEKARDIMLELTAAMPAERVELHNAFGRVLAQDVAALTDVPPFDRSPFDGYAFRSKDSLGASRDNPVVLRIIEEIPAGSYPSKKVTQGTAAKILTGSPIPEGADAVVKYEITRFDNETVSLFEPCLRRDIIAAGEDVKKGELLARDGDRIDPALLGTLAGQGISNPFVRKRPNAGIISTGSELVEVNEHIADGKIRNSNRYVLEGACAFAGAIPVNLGIAGDTAQAIAELLLRGLETCDILFSTGGVSVGDYDVTPEAMELAGIEVIVRKLDMKPGGACALGVKNGKPVFCLSGNPTAAAVSFYAVALPCLRKLTGLREYSLKKTVVTLADDYKKPSVQSRLLRGNLDLSGGSAVIRFPGQGNAMLHSMVGCDVLAVIPAGSPALSAGTKLEAYII